jgi:SET domain-containing protein
MGKEIKNGKQFRRNPPLVVEVRKSAIEGKGVFSASMLPHRKKIGEFAGELIGQREARRRAKGQTHIAIVELGDGRAVDASRYGNELRYINHSCSPNVFIRVFGSRIEFYALRVIQANEELTCDYGESHHNGTADASAAAPSAADTFEPGALRCVLSVRLCRRQVRIKS